MNLTSPAFEHFGEIPAKYTCQGEAINPPLEITDVPDEAASLALMVYDPDAPGGTFLHWVVWGIDPGTTQIPEDWPADEVIQGTNDAGSIGWTAPCPPSGRHRYVFRLIALNGLLEVRSDADIHEIKERINKFLIDQTELVGYYQKK